MLLEPYERACLSECYAVSVVPDRGRFVVSEPTANKIALYERSGVVARLIDVASPQFQRDGVRLSRNATATEALRWQEENSMIARALPLRDHIAIVHHRACVGENWVQGEPIGYRVWMNVHTKDGALAVADIPLPDLPIGHDDGGVFAIDYGERGRRSG